MSPVLALKENIASAAFKVAPELEQELLEWKDIEISIDDSQGFKFGVLVSEKEILTNIVTLNFLWCASYAHLTLYDCYNSSATSEASDYFSPDENPRSKTAMELLIWANINLQDGAYKEWPEGFPKPDNTTNEFIEMTNELFLVSVAWIIHHEIAHIRLEHSPVATSRALAEEVEADKEATNWILGKCPTDAEAKKRVLGIAGAILALQSLEDDRQYNILKTHPRAYERLANGLFSEHVVKSDALFAFTAVIMQIQLAYEGIVVDHQCETFEAMFQDCLLRAARKNG